MLRDVGQILSERARLSSDLEAIVDLARGRRFDYQTFENRANALAHILQERGVKKGDRVAILMSNSHVYMEAYFAIAKIGAIAVLLNWRLTPSELEYIVEDCSASALIYSQDLESLAEALKPLAHSIKLWIPENEALEKDIQKAPTHIPDVDISGDDPVFIMYTSGTTGKPKGAVMTHGASVAWHFSALATADNKYRDRSYTVAPLFHIGGIGVVTAGIHRGMTNVIDQLFDPGRVWRMIAQEKINGTFLVPAMLNFMLKHEEAWVHDHSHLRGIMCGAAPVPVSLIEAFSERGVDIHQVYGATETHGGICLMSPEKAVEKAGSTGRPYYGLEVRVVDEEGRDVPPGVPGEVITRGPHVLREYWNKPEETAKSFKNGWFYLGDVAEVDEDGFIYIKDRSKDMVISGGENIYPAEIENVILSNPGVAEVAVIGQPSEKWGESVCAVVVAKPGVDQNQLIEELQALSAEKLASYKRPKAFEFINEIPRNPSGKALKRLLRERFPGPAPE
ncbi:MAG: long-chain fatty acid--CoA ligase [Sphingomonadales bacterium]|jgi:O-succinylbenzoate-CoA ligase